MRLGILHFVEGVSDWNQVTVLPFFQSLIPQSKLHIYLHLILWISTSDCSFLHWLIGEKHSKMLSAFHVSRPLLVLRPEGTFTTRWINLSRNGFTNLGDLLLPSAAFLLRRIPFWSFRFNFLSQIFARNEGINYFAFINCFKHDEQMVCRKRYWYRPSEYVNRIKS